MMQKVSLLVTDVDGTLVGDERALARFAEWYCAHRQTLRLVYASGRFFASVHETIQTTALPEPAAIVGGVGTDIHHYPSGELVEEWHEKIDKNWDAKRLRQLLSRWPGLEPQPEELQSRFKVSYYLKDATPEQLVAIQDEVRDASIHADIIYSSKRDLDFVPTGANKGTAAAFLVSMLGALPENVIVSGDSGNDRALFEQGFLGVVVANAHPELKKLKGQGIYHARQPFAAGVLEGIEYWTSRL